MTERDIVDSWSETNYHWDGDRVRVDRRLVIERYDDNPQAYIRKEEKRTQTLGTGRDEHDWKTVESWEVAPHGTRKTS